MRDYIRENIRRDRLHVRQVAFTRLYGRGHKKRRQVLEERYRKNRKRDVKSREIGLRDKFIISPSPLGKL